MRRTRDTIPELRDKDRHARPMGVVTGLEDFTPYTEEEWLRMYAKREREQMDAKMTEEWIAELPPPRPYARPFPARAFLAFCVAGLFAWMGMVAALRWWMQ